MPSLLQISLQLIARPSAKKTADRARDETLGAQCRRADDALGDLQATGIQLDLLSGPLTGIYDPHGMGSMLFVVLAVAAQLDRDYIVEYPARSTRGGEGFAWPTSHVFSSTAATIFDGAESTARVIADQLGHSRPSTKQDVHMGSEAALESALTAMAFPGGKAGAKAHQTRNLRPVTWGFGGSPGDRTLNPRIKRSGLSLLADGRQSLS
ncbi:hypothetical protein [Saccharopolyspora sp. NPDC050642]|uniref:hypothetical protein n=1 Tax=Saccharopolyspora sp. NPDC050642 TaxID=3157099 RepID=UPI0033F82572